MADEDPLSWSNFWTRHYIDSKKQMFRGGNRDARSRKMKNNRIGNDIVIFDEMTDGGPSAPAITKGMSVDNYVDLSTSPVDEVLSEEGPPNSPVLSMNQIPGSSPSSLARRSDASSTAGSACTADTSTSSRTSKYMTDNPREG